VRPHTTHPRCASRQPSAGHFLKAAGDPMTADECRMLPPLEAAEDGCTDAPLMAHGFALEVIFNVVKAGLATAEAERLHAASQPMAFVFARWSAKLASVRTTLSLPFGAPCAHDCAKHVDHVAGVLRALAPPMPLVTWRVLLRRSDQVGYHYVTTIHRASEPIAGEEIPLLIGGQPLRGTVIDVRRGLSSRSGVDAFTVMAEEIQPEIDWPNFRPKAAGFSSQNGHNWRPGCEVNNCLIVLRRTTTKCPRSCSA
jgi:hypothetical protein